MSSVIQHHTVVWSGPIFYGPADITVAEQKYAIKAFTRSEWEFNPFVEPAAALAKLQGENPRALRGRNRRQNIRMMKTELQRVESGHAQVIRYTRNRPTKLSDAEKRRAYEIWSCRRFDTRASSAQKISDLLAVEGITAKKFAATTPPPRSPTPPPEVQAPLKPPSKSKDPAFKPKRPIKGYVKRRPRTDRKFKALARKKGYRDPETSDSDSEPIAIKKKGFASKVSSATLKKKAMQSQVRS